MSSLGDYAADDAVDKDLREALNRALRQVDKLKRARDDMADVVYQAAHDALSTLRIPPVPKPKADRRRRGAESCVVALSDWQLGKVTPDYDSEVCATRIAALADKVETLTAVQRSDHPVDECVVFLLGDLVEGEDIFPGQQHLIDASLYEQAVSVGPQILSGFVRRMAAIFPKVRVVGVIGNHGRIGRKGVNRPETNADAMMYEVARLITEDARVDWAGSHFQRGERAWHAVTDVRGNNFLTIHGDQIRGGFAGFPFYGLAKKIWGWGTLAQQIGVMDQFDYVLMGHWHTPTRVYLNGVTAWCSGSTESYNTYAIESLAAAGEPSQWVMYVHEDGVTAEYEVHL